MNTRKNNAHVEWISIAFDLVFLLKYKTKIMRRISIYIYT